MDNLTNHIDAIGLTNDDLDEKLETTDDLINYISSTSRPFRKTLRHILLKDIKLYFDNDSIKDTDDLRTYFREKDRKLEWIKFTHFFPDYKIPKLRPTIIAKALLTLTVLGAITFIWWLFYRHTDLLLTLFLIPFILYGGLFVLSMIMDFGTRALPAKTIDELIDKVITDSLADLLCDDKKKFKEIVTKELLD